jgi:hypothetical protein
MTAGPGSAWLGHKQALMKAMAGSLGLPGVYEWGWATAEAPEQIKAFYVGKTGVHLLCTCCAAAARMQRELSRSC